MPLNQKTCEPCRGGMPALTEVEATSLLKQTPKWKIIENNTKIFREFKFDNFVKAQNFINKVAEISELEQHHPDIEFGWGYARIYIQTHKINGLHENDFILASKIDQI